ncbi:hypothetical protein K488DRAFT_86321 [Vararia minispora EC-137]|uniref:Uncharacterized protein n=1 Tax=Vararia minispora EC-137 TaxID=1314806 RepID=A0ACB8QJU7_9AGAM|nr:hypothetical protein K488DRAFT_86321 [Vararia minispora EC-137]
MLRDALELRRGSGEHAQSLRQAPGAPSLQTVTSMRPNACTGLRSLARHSHPFSSFYETTRRSLNALHHDAASYVLFARPFSGGKSGVRPFSSTVLATQRVSSAAPKSLESVPLDSSSDRLLSHDQSTSSPADQSALLKSIIFGDNPCLDRTHSGGAEKGASVSAVEKARSPEGEKAVDEDRAGAAWGKAVEEISKLKYRWKSTRPTTGGRRLKSEDDRGLEAVVKALTGGLDHTSTGKEVSKKRAARKVRNPKELEESNAKKRTVMGWAAIEERLRSAEPAVEASANASRVQISNASLNNSSPDASITSPAAPSLLFPHSFKSSPSSLINTGGAMDGKFLRQHGWRAQHMLPWASRNLVPALTKRFNFRQIVGEERGEQAAIDFVTKLWQRADETKHHAYIMHHRHGVKIMSFSHDADQQASISVADVALAYDAERFAEELAKSAGRAYEPFARGPRSFMGYEL